MLLADAGGQFVRPITNTSRAPRPGEVDGVHYHFRTRPEFEAMIAAGEFVEHADVHGNLYGTSKASLDAIGQHQKAVLIIDCEGAASVRRTYPACTSIFIRVPLPLLRARLEKRGDSADAIERRMETAKIELQRAERDGFDHILVNEELEIAFARLKSVIGGM